MPKKPSAFASQSKYAKPNPSLFEIAKGAVPTEEVKKTVDPMAKRGEKVAGAVMGGLRKVFESEPDDFRGDELERYHKDHAKEVYHKLRRTDEENQYLKDEIDRYNRMKKKGTLSRQMREDKDFPMEYKDVEDVRKDELLKMKKKK